ncbi:hypothetical protein V2O64_10075 [Verrucomicrobiaceae bacterium 227]
MNEDEPLSDEQQYELLLNTTSQLHRSLADQLELAARVDGLEILLANLGNHVGISPDELVSNLRKAQATSHQKRLQMIEEVNPHLAALLDKRPAMPPIDETMLDKMDIGDWPLEDDSNGK